MCAFFVSVKNSDSICGYICAVLWGVIYFCLGQINLHCHHVSRRDMQLPHWFGSFLVCCKMSRTEVCKFYRRRVTFQYAVLTVGQYRGARIPGAWSPGPINFVWWCVILCGPWVPSCHLASRVLRSLLGFGEMCPPPPSPGLNPLTPNDPYSGRTAPLTSKRCILYIYSTNTGTEYFKHGIYSPFFSLQNAVSFIILTYLVPVLFTFYIQDVLKLKKKSGAKS